jgi:hypothetical protein
MTNKQYNVAKVDDLGVELMGHYPYIDKRAARIIRIRMKKTFPMNDYVVVNMSSYKGVNEDGRPLE